MILGGTTLRTLMSDETPVKKRLFIQPILDLDEQVNPNQAAIDLRLGFHFAICRPSTTGAIDECRDEDVSEMLKSVDMMFGHEYVPFGKSIVLHQNKFVLACTLEYVRIPETLVGYVIGRSSWGRLGLVVATAIGIHPGYSGCITLELRNLGETPLVLYPGQTVAQVFFHEAIGAEGGSGLGQYVGDGNLLPKRLSPERTRAKLRKMAGIV